MKLTAGQLERLQNRQHLFDAGYGKQRLGLELALVADDADQGALLAAAEVRLKAQVTDTLQNVLDVFVGGVGTEDNNHGGASSELVSTEAKNPWQAWFVLGLAGAFAKFRV